MLGTAVAAATLASLPAQAGYQGLIIFGDSLSDSGNNALALAPNVTPAAGIVNNSFIPTFPYAAAAPYPFGVYSNGPVWATHFAGALGLQAAPSLAGGGNFAFGGAVTGGTVGFPFSLTDQLGQYLGATGGTAQADYLYVVAGGGNDARAALDAIAANPANALAIIAATAAAYASNIGRIVDDLQDAGAKNIVVWNTPNVGTAPAVLAQGAGAAALATGVAGVMNDALGARLAGEAEVDIFDLFGAVAGIIAKPGAYGLSNVTDACILGACNAAEYLFWDGIHPSARGHQILANFLLAQVVPEPQTWLLLALGLAALAWSSRLRTR
jgi:outer membrane lipase/esterase